MAVDINRPLLSHINISSGDIQSVKDAADRENIGSRFDRLWDKVADWVCGTNREEAKKCLHDLLSPDLPASEKVKSFEMLKELAGGGYHDRFLSEPGATDLKGPVPKEVQIYSIQLDAGEEDGGIQFEVRTEVTDKSKALDLRWQAIENSIKNEECKPEAKNIFHELHEQILSRQEEAGKLKQFESLTGLEVKGAKAMDEAPRGHARQTNDEGLPKDNMFRHNAYSLAGVPVFVPTVSVKVTLAAGFSNVTDTWQSKALATVITANTINNPGPLNTNVPANLSAPNLAFCEVNDENFVVGLRDGTELVAPRDRPNEFTVTRPQR